MKTLMVCYSPFALWKIFLLVAAVVNTQAFLVAGGSKAQFSYVNPKSGIQVTPIPGLQVTPVPGVIFPGTYRWGLSRELGPLSFNGGGGGGGGFLGGTGFGEGVVRGGGGGGSSVAFGSGHGIRAAGGGGRGRITPGIGNGGVYRGSTTYGSGLIRGRTNYGSTAGHWIGRAIPLYRPPTSQVIATGVSVLGDGQIAGNVFHPHSSQAYTQALQQPPNFLPVSVGLNKGEFDPRQILISRSFGQQPLSFSHQVPESTVPLEDQTDNEVISNNNRNIPRIDLPNAQIRLISGTTVLGYTDKPTTARPGTAADRLRELAAANKGKYSLSTTTLTPAQPTASLRTSLRNQQEKPVRFPNGSVRTVRPIVTKEHLRMDQKPENSTSGDRKGKKDNDNDNSSLLYSSHGESGYLGTTRKHETSHHIMKPLSASTEEPSSFSNENPTTYVPESEAEDVRKPQSSPYSVRIFTPGISGPENSESLQYDLFVGRKREQKPSTVTAKQSLLPLQNQRKPAMSGAQSYLSLQAIISSHLLMLVALFVIR